MKILLASISIFILLKSSKSANKNHFCLADVDEEFQNVGGYTKWPQGIVKYYINETIKDSVKVFEAFEEFHRKTCIRFKPKEEMDMDYVSLEFVPDQFGAYANLCRRGGYQVARFGSLSLTKATIIHELGHSLCLGHEHQRADRDLYINIKKDCIKNDTKSYQVQSWREHQGFYDYASQMHYEVYNECISPKESSIACCGPDINSGLSALDADYLNRMYNCGGCHSHRWLQASNKTENLGKYRHGFGLDDINGIEIVPCRISVNGVISVGTLQNQTCIATHQGVKYENWDKFEVFTTEYVDNKGWEFYYSLADVHAHMTTLELDSIFEHAIVGGYAVTEKSGYINSYVGYAIVEVGPGEFRTAVGNVYRNGGGRAQGYFLIDGEEYQLLNFKVLVCTGNFTQMQEYYTFNS